MNKVCRLKSVLRFRRWSRMRYAAFCSVGRVVTIGNLRKSIVEASLNKQHGVVLTDRMILGNSDCCIAYDESGGGISVTDLWRLMDGEYLLIAVGQTPVPCSESGCKYLDETNQ